MPRNILFLYVKWLKTLESAYKQTIINSAEFVPVQDFPIS